MSKSSFAEFVGNRVQRLDVFDSCALKLPVMLAGNDRINIIVAKFATALDHRLSNPRLSHDFACFCIDVKDHADRQSAFTRQQGAELRRKTGWKHIDNSIHQVDTGPALL